MTRLITLLAGGGVGQAAERARQVDEGRYGAQDRRDSCGDVERPVDGRQAALVGVGPGDVDAEDRREGADGRHDQGEDEALGAEGDLAEDQGGDKGDRVRLEQVGGHTRAVADVVADVVGDRRGVARVVLGDVLLNLADEVGTDVGRLREDTAADTHEHGQQRRSEAEALEYRRCVALVDQDDGRGAEQTEPDGGHADRSPGPESDPHGRVAALILGGRCHPYIRLDGERHARVPDSGGESCTEQEEDRAADSDGGVAGKHEEQQEGDRCEDGQGLELPSEVGLRTLLDRLPDRLHVGGAFGRAEHLLAEQDSHGQRHDGDEGDDDHDCGVAPGQGHSRAVGEGEL